jgi:hypothetical protein
MRIAPYCFWLIALALGAALATPSVAGPCDGRILSAPDLSAEYAPFDAFDLRKEHRILVRNSGAEACVFWLGAIRLESGPPSAGALAFELGGTDGAWSGAAVGAEPIWLASRHIAPGESYDFTLTLSIPAGQVLPPGSIQHHFELALQGTAEGAPPPHGPALDSRPMQLIVSIADYLSITIAGAGLRKTVDFGELTEGARREVRIEARSNQRFSLEATSREGGALAMAPPYAQWRIAYQMLLDGEALALPGTLGPFAGTGLAGRGFDAVFAIGDVRGKRAGLYSDEVVIEIKPAP